MNIADFKAGSYKKGYKYDYFITEKVNHPFSWTDESINELLELASWRLGEWFAFYDYLACFHDDATEIDAFGKAFRNAD